MSEETRKIVFLVGFTITYAIRFYFARLAKQNKQVVDGRVTVQEKVLLVLTIVGMLVLPLMNVFTSWFDFAAYDLPDWSGWLGTIVFGLAIALFWSSHVDLGQNEEMMLDTFKEQYRQYIERTGRVLPKFS